MRRHKIIIFATLLAAMASCSDSSNNNSALDRVAEAEMEFARGNIDNARSLCIKTLADSAVIDKLPSAARTYLLNAVLMSKISEKTDDHSEEDMAIAAQNFNKAMDVSPDSVASITDEMSFDERSRVILLRQITGLIQLPDDMIGIDSDSIAAPGETPNSPID